MATPRTDQEILLDDLRKAIDKIDINTDGLELSIGGKYDSSGNRGGGLTNGDIVPVSLNVNGESIVALSAIDNAVLDAMVTDLAAMEVLLTAANVDHAANEVLLTGIANNTGASTPAGTNIIGSVLAISQALPAGSNTIGTVNLSATDNAVLDTIDAVLDTIKVDTEAIETAVEAVEVTQNRMVAPTSTVYLAGTKAFTGPFYAITALTDTVIDVSEGDTNIVESDDSGSMQATATNITLPAGISIYGNFAAVELDSGTAVGYAGAGVTVTVAS